MTDSRSQSARTLDQISFACAVLSAILGGIELVSSELGIAPLTMLGSQYVPIAPSTAFAVLLLGISLFIRRFDPRRGSVRAVSVVLDTVVIVFCLAVVSFFVAGSRSEFEHLLFGLGGVESQPYTGHMSPPSAFALILAGISSLLLHVSPQRMPHARSVAVFSASVVFVIGVFSCLGYLYDTPFFYGGTTKPIALPSALLFITLGIGLVTAGGSDQLPLRFFTGESVRSRLMRAFLPAVVVTVILAGWFETALLFPFVQNHALGSAVATALTLLVFSVIISRIAHVIGADVDNNIHQRKRAESELQKVNRALRTLSRCNEILVHASTEIQLLDDLCRVLTDEGGYRLAWVGYAEHDAEKTVRPVASKGFEEGYIERAHISWADTERGRGPTGTAIRTGEPSLCRNILTDPNFEPWRQDAIKRGYASSIVLPLKKGETSYGALNIYAVESDAFDLEELNLLSEFANDLSFGILALRDREERQRAEDAVRHAGAYNRRLIEASLDPLVTIGPDGKISDVNAATQIATGCSKAELIGTDFSDYFTEPDKARKGYEQAFREGFVRDYSLELRHRDGHLTSVLYNASVYRDEDGKVVGVFAAARDVTEKKRVQRAMEEEHQRFNQLLELLPAYVVLLTPDYHVPFANRFFRERFGEAKGRRCYEYLFGLQKPCEVCETYKVLDTHAPHHWEWLGPDGRNYDIYDFPFTDTDGSPLIMEMGLDITDLKQSLKLLAESETKFHTLAEQSLVGIALNNEQGYVYVNKRLADMFGYTVEEMMNTHPRNLISENDRAKVLEIMQKRLTGEVQQTHYTFQGKRKDGSLFDVEIHGSRMELGGKPATIAVMLDITERRKAEDALRKSEERLRHTMDTMLEGCMIIDFDWRYLYVNEAIALHGHQTREKLMGKTMLEVYPGVEQSTVFANYRRSMEQRITQRFEAEYAFPDGSTNWFEFSVQPVPEGIFVTSLDITERKRADEALRKYRDHLEDLVRERTSQLEFFNKELEAFAYSVSHDLRAPLRGIDGFSAALLEDYSEKLDEKGRDYLQRVRAAAQRMALLIDDMLELSRLTRSEMHAQQVHLSDLVRQIASEYQRSDPNRRVRFVIAENLAARGDPRLLRAVLENLLGNAWKFTSKAPQPVIEIGETEREGKKVFFVRDNGVGFDMQYAGRLFGVFQRLHSSTEFPGTGVGLATVQRIIHRHGGRVWAEAAVDRGATFYFTIPIEVQQ